MEDIKKNPKWEIKYNRKKGKLSAAQLQRILLANRGITTDSARKEFLDPKHPMDITLKEVNLSKKQMSAAISTIEKVSKNKQKVVVYGDYDADGVCASAILWETLHSLHVDAVPYLPDRFSDGYGLNKRSIDNLINKYPNLGLIITVDNGIVATDAVSHAKEAGISVIITDHHAPGETMPKADAIIHTTNLCGAAVAWMFAREIVAFHKSNKGALSEGLALAAIGTLADQVPLVHANRSFAKHGLELLNNTKRIGLLALFNQAGITKGAIGTYEVGFLIAPRINASGRMANAIDSLRLLCTKNVMRAQSFAHNLSNINQERQLEVTRSLESAFTKVRKDSISIVIAGNDYHEGVIGLIAGKLVERYYRPAIVISVNGKNAKASARSIQGFNIIDAIREHGALILEGGGHPMAAGFSILSENIEKFENAFEAHAKSVITDDLLERKLKVDLEIKEDEIGKSYVEAIQALEPFGTSNPTPLLLINGATISEIKTIGRDNSHLKFLLGKEKIESLAFGWGEYKDKLANKSKISCVCKIDENTWNGRTSIQLKIIDMSANL